MTRVTAGLEACLAEPPNILQGARFGLLLNQASVDRHFRHAHELLDERFPGQLAALFTPQHGLWCEEQDNMVETGHAVEPHLGIPIHSLYSETRVPSPEMLRDLELLVVDLQDVGTRVYTYIWTVSYCLEACASAGIDVLVLDRPNPLGGETAQGPRLDPAFSSFVGLAPIPMRHGLTMGEMALYLNDARELGADVQVVPMDGWRRDMLWAVSGIRFRARPASPVQNPDEVRPRAAFRGFARALLRDLERLAMLNATLLFSMRYFHFLICRSFF